MKTMRILATLLLVTLIVFQGAAYAKTVEGSVVSTDATANTLTVSQTDAATGAAESVTVSVTASTTYSGAASLGELQAGDAVSVEAEQDAVTGSWNASSVMKHSAAM